MSIRNRITWWFAGILSASLVIMGGVFRFELGEDRERLRTGQPLESSWEETFEFVFFFGLPTALLLLAGGSWLLRRSLRPLPRLTRAIENLQLTCLDERLPLAGTGDELDRLTEVFNGMAGRLKASFAHVREFTLHASHELKTPLTIMQGTLEGALDDPEVVATQRELIINLLDEVQRLARIVDSLTMLAKADAGQLVLHKELVRLDQFLRDSFADTQMLARPQRIAVALSACDEAWIQGDRHRLRQLFLNLSDNAIKHNHSEGRVEMALTGQDGWATLRMSNTGRAIPPRQLQRVFDRFFRGDPAHGSEPEGSGLGLAIAQWIAHAHGGTIRIDSRSDGWTTVEVRLPQSRPDDAPRMGIEVARLGGDMTGLSSKVHSNVTSTEPNFAHERGDA